MENGRSKDIIDKLIDMIENGQSVPLTTGKVMVNKDEAVLMLRELESIVDGELKVYREVNDKRGKIINDAKKEAEEIVYEAEKTASRIRVTKHMSSVGSGFRASDLDADEKNALRTASDIYAASLIYTDEMLTEVTDVIAQAYDIINNQYGRMVETLEEKAKLVADNKAELMASLKELSKEERYLQILDLSQLLSNELYREREKAKEATEKVIDEENEEKAKATDGEINEDKSDLATKAEDKDSKYEDATNSEETPKGAFFNKIKSDGKDALRNKSDKPIVAETKED